MSRTPGIPFGCGQANLAQTSILQSRPTTTAKLPATSFTATDVTAGATGDGPADQGECDRWAININHYMALAESAAENGNDAEVDKYGAQAAAYEDQAMDRGCFIVD